MFGAGLAASAQTGDRVEQGLYLVTAGGCISCHTDYQNGGAPFAGGAPIATRFGIFYPPNITSDKAHGIGAWSEDDFIRAMREGVGPDGAHFFPSFPYTSYTQIRTEDLRVMKAYMDTIPPVPVDVPKHDIVFPFSWRFLQTGWKLLFFTEGEFKPNPAATEQVNRGAYLSNALAHCGECHTPRNKLGGLDQDKWLAGSGNGPEGAIVPNITPDPETGLDWTVQQIADYLKSGATPEFDFAGSLMAEVIEHNTGKLTDYDRLAIAAYLKALKPLKNEIKRAK